MKIDWKRLEKIAINKLGKERPQRTTTTSCMDFYLGFFFTWKVNAGKVGVLSTKYIHTLFTYSHTSLRWESSKYYYAVNVDFGQQKSRILVCIVLLFFRKTDDP